MNAQTAAERGRAFLEDNAKKADVKTTASGLQYTITEPGTGKAPKATDKVTVHYTGKLLDGTVFDSSHKRGQPATFPLNGVIRGWTEGLQLVKEGGKIRLYIPSNLAYCERGQGPIGPNETLVFDVELIKVEQSAAERGRAFLAENAKKADVKTTPSGLQYTIVKPGKGKAPKASDTVEVHYAGTLLDGKEFDSSYKRGKSISFPLGGVIPGWTEGLQLVKEGGKIRLFIPSELAYGSYGSPGAIGPDETLIFDVELIKVNPKKSE